MKYLSKLAAYFFPRDSGDISLLLLAIAAAASSAGIVSIGLLVAIRNDSRQLQRASAYGKTSDLMACFLDRMSCHVPWLHHQAIDRRLARATC